MTRQKNMDPATFEQMLEQANEALNTNQLEKAKTIYHTLWF